jgi:hypothetical protein
MSRTPKGTEAPSVDQPTSAFFEAWAADCALPMPPDRVEVARELHVRYRYELDLLRSVRLEPVGDPVIPESATAWIQRGGRSG